jgi:hypothetical protein
MSITWDANATRPINLYGLIPHGSAFSLPISQDANTETYNWNVDIASGSEFLLFMSDAGQYQTGGSTGLLTVGNGNTNCMTSSSPASITTSASSTSTSAPASTSASSSTSSGASASASVAGVGGSSSGGNVTAGAKSSPSHTGAIVGGAIGGVAFLLLLALLLLCCIRRRSRSRSDGAADPAVKSYGLAANAEKPKRGRGALDLLGGRGRVASDELIGGSVVGGRSSEMGGHHYEPVPFRYPSPPPASSRGGHAATPIAPIALSEKVGSSPTTRNRPSMESNNTIPPSQPTNTPPGGSTPPGSYPVEATTPLRHSSIRKTPSSQHLNQGVPSSPAMGEGRGSGEGGRPLPSVPVPGEGTRFVQHEDSGEVV